jgi:outer membrane protein assembly factor BamB
VLTRINADDVDDIVGFFKVWDGRSAWAHYAGAFDGATLKLLWQSEPVDPQLIKQPGVAPIAVVLGRRVVIGDASPTLRVFDVRSGEKLSTLQLMGPVMDVCPMPNSADRIWIRVADGGDTVFDLATEKSDPGPRPKGCPEPQYENTTIPKPPVLPTPKDLQAITDKTAEVLACDRTFENAMLARASCHAPASSPPAADASTSAGFVAAYELSDGSGLSVALGTKSSRPVASSTTKGAPWERELVPADTKAKLGAPPVADLAFERLYVVSERVYFDARLTALDAHTGAVVWEAPLTGSLPRSDGSGRGDARALVTTAARVYVVRAGGALDVFDASSGKPAGSIGKQ